MIIKNNKFTPKTNKIPLKMIKKLNKMTKKSENSALSNKINLSYKSI